MNAFTKPLIGVAAALLLAAAAAAGPGPRVMIQADKIVLLDFTVVGKTLVAVGERGVVMRSDDAGRTWSGQQAPTTRALTSVAFLDERVGVAVGHGGTLLRTEDGGKAWQPVAFKEIGQDAVLGVTPLRSGVVVAYGAFGMYLVSADQGRTWRRENTVSPEFDRHISKVIETGKALWLVAETGVIARSKDQGRTWEQVRSPYEGSYFGILETRGGALLAFGMRGNVFRSADDGATWAPVPFGSKATLNGGSVGADGRIVLAGNRGLVAVSDDDGKTFLLHKTPEGASVSQARIVDGALVYTGNAATGRLALHAGHDVAVK